MIGGNLGAAIQMLKVMNQQGGGGQSWESYWSSLAGIALKSKLVGWWEKSSEQTNYYIDCLRTTAQERELLTEGVTPGIIHPGRAICYDGSKSQKSMTQGNLPANFQLVNNSLTIYIEFKMDSAPAASSMILGDNTVGADFVLLIGTDGKVIFIFNPKAVTIYSDNNICDGKWHKIFISIDKTGYLRLYVDNILNGSSDLSGASYVVKTAPWNIGGRTSYFNGIKYLKNFRLFSRAITSETERDAVHNGDYIADCIAWWMMESGKESSVYDIKDCVGTNHLINTAFDASSFATLPAKSMLNKYGYSTEYEGTSDLIEGQGNFSASTQWTTSVARWAIGTTGYARFLGTGNYQLINNIVQNPTIPIGTVIKATFDIDENTASFRIVNASVQTLCDTNNYAIGSHTVIFRCPYAVTKLGLFGYGATPFRVDNLTFKIYEAAYNPPLINAAIPTTDLLGRVLTFSGQAKYNLIKVSEGVVKMPDYLGELFDATELITENDWYDASGIAQSINWADINYQSARQYVSSNKLIIVDSAYYLTAAEDLILQRYINS